ncbi:GNAT family N-acetyltransferase [Halobacillus litoralis]|uniref:GNAT family N-acetyltransferase n=1 Tax=Halobacillus litoralis TaxID=45668 RepID=A0A410MA13_9BACI|nr:GNAT family N-acetyltransferase [Halobacillus litoralis]QAS51571.1 GNAT family N-acetyltransferase [Halobacillus litoralis]
MNIHFTELKAPDPSIINAFNRWENDPRLVPLTRPNKSNKEIEGNKLITIDDLTDRLKNHPTYLIYSDDKLVGEMNYMVDPPHLYKKEPDTAWIGITIGEEEGRGKGIGYHAIQYLEQQIEQHGLKRIELGVFEFNTQAQKLYQKLGYNEIGRIPEFTYWNQRLWSDIRMEKRFDS